MRFVDKEIKKITYAARFAHTYNFSHSNLLFFLSLKFKFRYSKRITTLTLRRGQMSYNNAYTAYQKTNVKTASQGHLIVLLYEAAVKNLRNAMSLFDENTKIAARDIEKFSGASPTGIVTST